MKTWLVDVPPVRRWIHYYESRAAWSCMARSWWWLHFAYRVSSNGYYVANARPDLCCSTWSGTIVLSFLSSICTASERRSAVRSGSACPGHPDEDGRQPRLRELAVVGLRAPPHRRAPQSDARWGAGAGAAPVQTSRDGRHCSGGPSHLHRRRATTGGGERNPGERRLGSRAWLCDIPQATGQSVRLSRSSTWRDYKIWMRGWWLSANKPVPLRLARRRMAASTAEHPTDRDGARGHLCMQPDHLTQ